MKYLILLISLVLAGPCLAAKKNPQMSLKASKIETVSNTSSTDTKLSLKNSDERVHFSTNIAGILNAETNVSANFFIMPKVALSVTYGTAAEKTAPLKKAAVSTTRYTVTTTQFGVGAAYYFFPLGQKWNVIANPYMLSERKSDPIDTENTLGIGLKVDGMFRFYNLALSGGIQSALLAGDTSTKASASVGYLF